MITIRSRICPRVSTCPGTWQHFKGKTRLFCEAASLAAPVSRPATILKTKCLAPKMLDFHYALCTVRWNHWYRAVHSLLPSLTIQCSIVKEGSIQEYACWYSLSDFTSPLCKHISKGCSLKRTLLTLKSIKNTEMHHLQKHMMQLINEKDQYERLREAC